jgi:hypothetical protein
MKKGSQKTVMAFFAGCVFGVLIFALSKFVWESIHYGQAEELAAKISDEGSSTGYYNWDAIIDRGIPGVGNQQIEKHGNNDYTIVLKSGIRIRLKPGGGAAELN